MTTSELIVPLIVKYGIPTAYAIWNSISKHQSPTDAMWQELLALNAKTDEQYLKEAQERSAQTT